MDHPLYIVERKKDNDVVSFRNIIMENYDLFWIYNDMNMHYA